jgi:hypothetical protein
MLFRLLGYLPTGCVCECGDAERGEWHSEETEEIAEAMSIIARKIMKLKVLPCVILQDGRINIMQIIYVVSRGHYARYNVEAVFSSRELAEDYIQSMNVEALEIQEFKLDLRANGKPTENQRKA